MSIEIENPKTVAEKIDAAANLIEQMFLANKIGDQEHFSKVHKKAGQLLFDANRQLEVENDNVIRLTPHEIQSTFNRQKQAEGIIVQMPQSHEGASTWLLNYGVSPAAEQVRTRWCIDTGKSLKFDEETQAYLTVQ